MDELKVALWRLGIPVKTEHNEVAPSQHELAPVYESCNIATDHNQLTMELMQKLAPRHGLVCLLHEKPFDGVNGSGKHNNWSLATDSGINLLSPGKTSGENLQFLLFLASVIKAVDNYQDLLRLSTADAGNDHRLGASEAPPAIVSIFLGTELMEILTAIEKDADYAGAEKSFMKLGVSALPAFLKDSTDRNRTSPFAFTGNKFEFRMLESSNSIACPNIMLNSAVADTLRLFADRLEKSENTEKAVHELIKETVTAHRRIIFNGNGYDESWVKEATEKRGLLDLRTTPDCMPRLLEKKNVDMLTGLSVFSEAELHSRYEIQLENYCKTVLIEAKTMLDMAQKNILPAICANIRQLADTAAAEKAVVPGLECEYEKGEIIKLNGACKEISGKIAALKASVNSASVLDIERQAVAVKDLLIPAMAELRAACDNAEQLCSESLWGFPGYDKLLFSVR